MMKIGKISVKHTYKLARIISDVLSLVPAYVIVSSTLHFIVSYKDTINPILEEKYLNRELWVFLKYGESLGYRQYFMWIFPALVAGVFAAYLILTLKNHKFAKYKITKQNAQSVYDWYAFAVSLCKIPILLGVFEIMYITQQRLMFKKVSLFSMQLLLYAVIVVIIIRLSVHRIKAITKPAPRKEESGGVKAKIVDDESDNG